MDDLSDFLGNAIANAVLSYTSKTPLQRAKEGISDFLNPLIEATQGGSIGNVTPEQTRNMLAMALTIGGPMAKSGNALRQELSETTAFEKAYALGKQVRELANGEPSTKFYNDWAFGKYKNTLPDTGFNNFWDSDPVTYTFYRSGELGTKMPEKAIGMRRGMAPESGKSWNQRENKYEPGVSMESVDHPDFRDYTWHTGVFSQDRPIYRYGGYVLPYARGGDNEPLMVGLERLHGQSSSK